MRSLANDRHLAPGELASLSDGIVHFELSGPAEGELVVLVHGFSTPCFGWDGVVGPLRDAGFRVLRYDLYGRGWSDRPAGPYDPDLFDRQLVSLLAYLGLHERLSVVGWSMGAVIASTFAHRRLQRVRRLALLAPAGLPVEKPAAAKLLVVPGVGELLVGLLGGRTIVANQRKLFYDTSGVEAFVERFRVQLRYPGFRRALLSTLRHMPIDDHAPTFAALGRANLPTAVIWGRDDHICPFANHERLLALMPSATLYPLERAGHALAIEAADRVAEHLVAHLRG